MRNFLSSNVLLSLLNFQTRLRKDLSNRVSLDQIRFVKRAPCTFSRAIFFFFHAMAHAKLVEQKPRLVIISWRNTMLFRSLSPCSANQFSSAFFRRRNFRNPTDSDSWINSTSNFSFFLSFRNAKLSRELFAKCRFRFSNVISIPVKFEVSSDLFIFSEEEEKSRIERARIPYTARIKEEKRGKRTTCHYPYRNSFVRVLIKRDCIANGKKGGNRSGRKGRALLLLRAFPSISRCLRFLSQWERGEIAQRSSTTSMAREKRVGWLLSFLPSNLDRGEKGKGKKLSRFPASRRLIAWNVANHVRTKETRSKRPRSTRGPFLTKNWNASQHIPRGCGSRPGT